MPPLQRADFEAVSAAADGCADALDSACTAWRDDAATRQRWHRYHLIGEALRAGAEVDANPRRDAAFLQAVRARLAREPRVPMPRVVPPAAWHVPVAVAASLAMVCTALWVARLEPVVQAAGDPVLLTDPRLDEFLRAHHAAGGGFAPAADGGTWRRVDLQMAPVAAR